MPQEEVDYELLDNYQRNKGKDNLLFNKKYTTALKVGVLIVAIAIFYFIFGLTSPTTPEEVAQEQGKASTWLPILVILAIGVAIYGSMTDKDVNKILPEHIAREILKYDIYTKMNDTTSKIPSGALRIGGFTRVYRITNKEIPWYYAYGFMIILPNGVKKNYVAGVCCSRDDIGMTKYIDEKHEGFEMSEHPDEVYVPPSKYMMIKDFEQKHREPRR